MSTEDERERFRTLPEPVRPEDAVETVDVDTARPTEDEAEKQARFLRDVGGAG